MASTPALDVNFTPVLVTNLNQPKSRAIPERYLRDGRFRNAVRNLRLGRWSRFRNLVENMEDRWTASIGDLKKEAMQFVSDESDSESEDEASLFVKMKRANFPEEEATSEVLIKMAREMLRTLVEKEKREHPEDFQTGSEIDLITFICLQLRSRKPFMMCRTIASENFAGYF